jgi:hypothetical protein
MSDIWASLRESIRGEADGTTIPVPVEDIRSLIAEHERVTDEQIEAAQDAFHEFIFGFEGPLTRRDKSITRQGWRVALEAARNA